VLSYIINQDLDIVWLLYWNKFNTSKLYRPILRHAQYR